MYHVKMVDIKCKLILIGGIYWKTNSNPKVYLAIMHQLQDL